MAVTVPALHPLADLSNKINTLKTQISAASTAPAVVPSLQQQLIENQRQLVYGLMAHGALNPATILSTCTWGT